MKDKTHYPLLAGYVDDELTSEERRRVDDQLARNSELVGELAIQRESAEAMAAYPLAEVDDSQWRRLWQEIGSRLPAGAKRISLESLTEMDISADMLNEEDLFDQPVPVVLPQSPLVAVKTDTLPPVPPRATSGKEKYRGDDSSVRPVRLDDARPAPAVERVKFPRRRHRIWAHVAGIAAAVAIMAMVVLSVRPVIPEVKLARAGEVMIEMEVTDISRSMIRMMQDEQGQSIPMIWIAQAPNDLPDAPDMQLN